MDKNNDFKEKMTFKIVLYQPEIPINTGNIGRLCLGANAELHIIKPMRFFINDKYLKRAGMDYWDKVQLFIHDDFDTFLKSLNNNRIFFCTTKSTNSYHINQYKIGDVFVFGPESRGLPEDMLNKYKNDLITIPMHKEIRSINLCNSVSIILYEALRQQNFSFLV